MRPPRFRVRTLMILVAVIALACGGTILMRKRISYLERAALYAEREAYWAWLVNSEEARLKKKRLLLSEKAMSLLSPAQRQSQEDYVRRMEPLHEESIRFKREILGDLRGLRIKYQHAASHPWISVPPDPPELANLAWLPAPPEPE